MVAFVLTKSKQQSGSLDGNRSVIKSKNIILLSLAVHPTFQTAFLFYYTSTGASLRTDVQWGQRVASIAISLLQKSHFFVVGALGVSGALPMLVNLFIDLTRRKITKARIIKLRTFVINAPYLISTPRTVKIRLLKSVLPKRPINGEIISFTSDDTID